MKPIAIIPARGGSKRIPEKNIRNFRGTPIIAYPLIKALESNLFSRVLVSTDDPNIGKVALQYGAEVSERSENLADDHTGLMEVMSSEAARLSELETEICFILATALFFTSADLIHGKKLLGEPGVIFSLPSQSFPAPVERAFTISAHHRTQMLNPEKYGARSQDCESAFYDSGQFYWGAAKDWISPPKEFFGLHTATFELENRFCIDIDNLADWDLAERIYPALNQ